MSLTAEQKRAIEEFVFEHVDSKSIVETFDDFKADDREAIEAYIQELQGSCMVDAIEFGVMLPLLRAAATAANSPAPATPSKRLGDMLRAYDTFLGTLTDRQRAAVEGP